MQKKDKAKVFGGDWTEDQLREFMEPTSYDGTDPDYIAGIRAYRYMVPATFQQFVDLFKAEGHNLNAQNLQGVSLAETMDSHIQGKEYADILRASIG